MIKNKTNLRNNMTSQLYHFNLTDKILNQHKSPFNYPGPPFLEKSI